MKNKRNTAAIIAGVIILAAALNISAARDRIFNPVKIGVVSTREVFDKCAKKEELETKLSEEGNRIFAELRKLEEAIESDTEALKTRKEGTDDFMALTQEIMLKKAALDAKTEFYKQQMTMKEMQGKEELYKEILSAVKTVAEENALDMVVNRDDNYFNSDDVKMRPANANDMQLTIRTHKLLYFNKQLDITGDVLAVFNAKNSPQQTPAQQQ